MADSQVPWGVDAPAWAITDPGWRTKPSWYLVATEDRMIPPPAQHTMADRIGATRSEVAASHSVYLSQPEAVATLIARASAGAAERADTTPDAVPTLTVAAAPQGRRRRCLSGHPAPRLFAPCRQ